MARREETAEEPRSVYTMRLGDDERLKLAAAARRNGEALSAYIRRVALHAAREDLAR
jgi:hypothetical protein